LQEDRRAAAGEHGAHTEAHNSGGSSQLQQQAAGSALIRVSGSEPAARSSFIRRQTAGALQNDVSTDV